MKTRVHGLGLLFVCLLASGCGEAARAWMDETRSLSEAADSAMDRGEARVASESLRRLLDRPVPDGIAEDDARVVRQDAYERLARLTFEAGELAEAAALVEEGLALGERDDVFTANLITLRARIHEAAGRDHEAAADYHRALLIHEALLDEALGADGLD